jgi:hypothetical protein
MTTTQAAPDLTIVSGATQDDARTMLKLAQLWQTDSHSRGSSILWATDTPMTYEQFNAAHPRGSQGFSDVLAVISWYETIGTLVKNGLLNRALVHDWLWVGGIWERCAPIALAQRATSTPRMWENFEALAQE